MKKLKKAIKEKQRWEELSKSIELVDNNRLDNPNIALDAAKTILESIAKTILTDKSIKYESDSKIQFLVKESFENLPIFSKLRDQDSKSAKSIIGSFENITKKIGAFRNRYGFFSHGQDLQSDKFDKYLIELVISSSDLISSFLIISHSEDLKDRARVYYDENEVFNNYLDNTEEVVISNITIDASRALFTDEEAYKDRMNAFVDEKTTLIKKFKDNYDISVLGELVSFSEYLTDEEKIELTKAITKSEIILSDENHDEIKDFIANLHDKKEDE